MRLIEFILIYLLAPILMAVFLPVGLLFAALITFCVAGLFRFCRKLFRSRQNFGNYSVGYRFAVLPEVSGMTTATARCLSAYAAPHRLLVESVFKELTKHLVLGILIWRFPKCA